MLVLRSQVLPLRRVDALHRRVQRAIVVVVLPRGRLHCGAKRHETTCAPADHRVGLRTSRSHMLHGHTLTRQTGSQRVNYMARVQYQLLSAVRLQKVCRAACVANLHLRASAGAEW